MIKYIGSKRVLVPRIVEAVREATGGKPTGTVLDLFSGTSRVGHALKAAGYRVIANDHNAYAATLARCYVQADAQDWEVPAARLVDEFNRLAAGLTDSAGDGANVGGEFTETYCRRSRYFQPVNGARIEAVRRAIAAGGLPEELEAVMLVSLMEAADRVDSTTGVQMAYLKEWAPRAYNRLELRVPRLLPRAGAGKGEAHRLDALEAAGRFEVDVAYLDPPYNQHSYLGNYHVWETLVRWDAPEVYGVACKRLDVRERRSVFNARGECLPALRRVLASLRARAVVVSFNNEGYVSREEMEAALSSLWCGTARVRTLEVDHKRYVGAQIGIYNPRGEKVGTPGHLRNKELIYIATQA